MDILNSAIEKGSPSSSSEIKHDKQKKIQLKPDPEQKRTDYAYINITFQCQWTYAHAIPYGSSIKFNCCIICKINF